MQLKSNLSFNKSNICKNYSKNKSAEKNIIQLKRTSDKQKYVAYILNNNIIDKKNLETNENSSDISFSNISLKNQILSPEEEDDIYQYNKKNKEIIEKNNDDIDCNFIGLRNINNLNLVSEKSKKYKKEKKTLILDLDETLVHSSFQPMKVNNKLIKPDIYFKIFFNYKYQEIYAYTRPFLNQFLKEMHNLFNIYVFTASIKKYAKPLLSLLDMNNYIIKKFYRESCTLSDGKFIKDLKSLNLNLNDVIILDNNPISYKYNKRNGLPIKSWHYDKNDKELIKIIPLLNFLSTVDDVRKYISSIIENDEINFNKVNMLIHSSNKKGNFYSFNKLIRHNSNNIRLNKKINYNIDEEIKVNNINNNYNGTINFREPLKNKNIKPNNDYNYSFNYYKNNEPNKKIKKRKKIKSNSINNINFNLNQNELVSNLIENNSNLNLNNKLNDIYYKSCNNFYINNKYSFVINKEKENKKNSIKNKVKNLYLNNEESDEYNIINKYKSNKSKSKRIPFSRKSENKICLNKKLSNTEREQNIVINKKSKYKNYLNRFNSYKNIEPYKNFNSYENDYYTITPLIKNKEDNYLRKNNTIEALGNHRSNSIRNIICYNSSNFTNTLNNNISSKNTLNYDRLLFNINEKKNEKCINTKFATNNYKFSNNRKQNTTKRILALLNNEENNIINKNNIHKILTDRNNVNYNINDNNLFNNYSLKKEKVNFDTNCYVKRKMKLKKSLLNNKNILKENSKSGLNEENAYHFQLLNYFPSSERNSINYY